MPFACRETGEGVELCRTYKPFIAAKDVLHSKGETRFYTLGQTDAGRRLFIVFTIRKKLIRIISAREMTRRERRRYEHGQKAGETDGA